ncbi:TRAP transporter small permease [Pusillimonas caeni]|uniref:TRAP transporter small permease n=1 Tax=Pusillimonas caeni TaxID=1348472 RepID=UPI0014320132|nr:TRAP transporter small permease [Pusillimonas caeni]
MTTDHAASPPGAFGKAVNGFMFLLAQIASICFAAALVINFANVVGRYVFHAPIFWAEEITIILIIWAVCLMSFRLTLRGEHLVTDILRPYLPVSMQKILVTLTTLAGMALSIFIVYYAFKVVDLVHRMGQVTVVAELPKSVAYGSILVCFVLAVAGAALRIGNLLKGDRRALSPHDTLDVPEVAEARAA